MDTPAIEVRGLRMSYEGTEVLHGVDFDVHPGEVFGLLGPNGAGKTTTIEILEGYRERSAGAVSVFGADPGRPTRAWREQIGLVLQECEFDPLLTVGETLSLFSAFYRAPRPVDEAVELVGLADRRDQRVGTLSGGQRRRLDVAIGLVHEPQLLFLDEPSTGLDPQNRANLQEHVERLHAEHGTTIVLTTHYLDEADALADRVVVIDHGKRIADDTPERLKADHAGDRITLTFDNPDDVRRAESQTLGIPGVRTGLTLTLRADGGRQLVPKLMRGFDEVGVQVSAVEVARPTLDDVFLALTGRSLREENQA
jgi:ABC-2 type transport system ATP-binding protein